MYAFTKQLDGLWFCIRARDHKLEIQERKVPRGKEEELKMGMGSTESKQIRK